MKHKRQFFLIPIGLLTGFIVFSCNLEIPERVSVKTSGTKYEFPLGEGSFMLREKMSAAELRNTFNENLSENSPEIKVYEYNPTKNDEDVLQYLIKYPIQEVSLALSADGTNDMSFSSKFEISNLNDRIGSSLKIEEKTYPVAELGTSVAIPDANGIDFNISSPDFDEISLSAGSFFITVNPQEAFSEDFVLNARVILCDSAGNEIASSEERSIAAGTGETPLTVDLAGKTLYPNMSFKLAGTMSGGTPGKTNSLAISMQAGGLKIKSVSGLTMTAEDIGDLDNDPATPDGIVSFASDFNFDGVNDYLISAEIEKGTLNLFSKIPEGWSGVDAGIENINISQAGGLSVDEESFVDGENDGTYLFNKTALLENQTFLPEKNGGKIAVSGQVSVSFENASLVFDEALANPEIEVGGSCQIEKLGNLKIDISALGDVAQTTGEVDTGLSFSTLLSDKLGDAGGLIKNLQLSGVEGYVYAVQPGFEVFNNTSYSNCKIEAVYETEGAAKNLELVTGSLELKETNLDLDALSDEDFVITDSSVFGNYSVKTSENVCQLLNDMPDNLKIRYELSGFTNPKSYIELTSDDFDRLTELKSVQIFVLFKIPVQFTLEDKVDYPSAESVKDGVIKISDVKKLVESINSDGEESEADEDLLKRDSQEDFEDVKKYLDLVESVSVFYKTKNSTQLEISGSMYDAATGIQKDLTIASDADYGKNYMEIKITDRDDLKKIFNTYPFNPNFQVSIQADGELREIPRNASFGITGYVQIYLSGEVEIWSKNKENE